MRADFADFVHQAADRVALVGASGAAGTLTIGGVNKWLAAGVALVTIIYVVSKTYGFWMDRRRRDKD